MIELQHRLFERFSALRDSRQGVVYFVEHGLEADEVDELVKAVRESLMSRPLDSDWWESHDLPMLIVATEVGYRYRGSGTDFWPMLEAEVGIELSHSERQRVKDLFVSAAARFRGARPPATPWALAFHLIVWPITHALLPLEFHRPLATTLANLRASAADSEDRDLYEAVRFAAPYPTARFLTLLEDPGVVVSLTRSLLVSDYRDLSAEIIRRISADLNADGTARRSFAVARSIQRVARASAGGELPLSASTPTEGALQLRISAGTLLLEASFPQLGAETVERLRPVLRRRRFAPRLWGVTARVSSDQLLSGLPFQLKFTKLPESGAPLFPDLETLELDAKDLATLHGFDLNFAPPHLFAVNSDGDHGRPVYGSIISAYRRYWALIRQEDEGLRSAKAVADLGPLRCFELDPSSPTGARSLVQAGYVIRRGVSVRFAGTPPINRGGDIPTFLVGDKCIVVPERLTGEDALVISLNGREVVARSSDVVRVTIEAGDHRVLVSSGTDAREYIVRGVGAPLAHQSQVSIDLRSEERTVQALLGGRLSFTVDGVAPIDGLQLTVDLETGGRVFSATGPLGLIPQAVSTEHEVMKALLSEDVRDYVSGASLITLRARVGNLAQEAWQLERIVRQCWWDLAEGPILLSENGRLRFGVVSANDPVRAPTEGAAGDGTYLLAPIGLDPLEFSRAATFTTFCIAPKRVHLGDLSVHKPRLERRRRGSSSNVGLEDLFEAYLRWSLAESRSSIADLHRRQVTMRIDEWITEICCGPEWALAEAAVPGQDLWGILQRVCQEVGVGRDDYLELATDIEGQVRKLAVDEIRRTLPALWSRIHPKSDLDNEDYEALDRAFATAYQLLAVRYRSRGRHELAARLNEADPGESPDEWEEALTRVREQVELRGLAALLLPSNSVARLMTLDVGETSVDEVSDELAAWAQSARKAFAGPVPPRDTLKVCYAIWIEPSLALTMDWRLALDTLLAERAVARATRYLAVKARQARWSRQ